MKPVAIELDVLGDTRPLWNDWLADAARRFHSITPLDPSALPEDRTKAAAPRRGRGIRPSVARILTARIIRRMTTG